MTKKQLLIVESPAKARTIAKFLDDNFVIKSSYGHIRDLPKKGISVDIQHGFKPEYQISEGKRKVVSELKKEARDATKVWLASDEDREGEAIAWHLSQLLNLDESQKNRIVFHEITRPAIEAALKKPRSLDVDLVNAQQARRVLDRIVGYELSPILWKKVQPGLSAGRVQSVAVRLIVEREREIAGFKGDSNYKITATLGLPGGGELLAEGQRRPTTRQEAGSLLSKLISDNFTVESVVKSPSLRNPPPPFITSTLQQAASNRLGFSPKQTMMLAQRLYESGHITYMRTDSLNLSAIALKQMAGYIKTAYGEKYLRTRHYKTKSVGAQEAHEAIRPTDINKASVVKDAAQNKLYQLIWRRTLASQMTPAQLEKTVIGILAEASDYRLSASGAVVLFDGFLKLDPPRTDASSSTIPPVEQGQKLEALALEAAETLSRPPARYTEASLIRQLEAMGIGRPSTYAPTISTITERGYVVKGDVTGTPAELIRLSIKPGQLLKTQREAIMRGADKGKLLPTDIGNLVTDFLINYFPQIVDYDFTKDLEEEFDLIARRQKQWQEVLRRFYGPFKKTVNGAEGISRAEASGARELGVDPRTKRPVIARMGRFGPMVQLGRAEDDKKPEFTSIPKGQSISEITLEEALRLLALPRTVGQTEQGETIEANHGRFGPYLKVGRLNVSIKGHDPHNITLEEARQAVAKHKAKLAAAVIKSFDKEGITVKNGPFGPYVTNGRKNARIPKDENPAKLSLSRCQELLAAKKPGRQRYRRKTDKA